MTILSLAVFAASLVAFCVALGGLLDTGTCGSGNTPYVIAKQCPDGTGSKALLLGVSIVGLIVAFGISVMRGAPPRGRRFTDPSLMLFMWAAFFAVTGAYALIHSLGSSGVPSDGKLGGTIVGITFLIMGLPALAYWAWTVIGSIGDRNRSPSISGFDTGLTPGASGSTSWPSSFAPSAPTGASDATISELERLTRLRDSGALTPAEFEAQKARILR